MTRCYDSCRILAIDLYGPKAAERSLTPRRRLVLWAAGLGVYTASKHGVIGLAKSAALEYAAIGLQINAIYPAPIDRPMVQQALADEPEAMNAVIAGIPVAPLEYSEEIASAVLWLCSPGAGFMTGQAVAINGGSLQGKNMSATGPRKDDRDEHI